MVPHGDAVAAAAQAETAGEAIERRGDIAYDATHHQRLNAVAVGTRHHDDMLSHKTTALVVEGLVTTAFTAISLTMCHFLRNSEVIGKSRSPEVQKSSHLRKPFI